MQALIVCVTGCYYGRIGQKIVSMMASALFGGVIGAFIGALFAFIGGWCY